MDNFDNFEELEVREVKKPRNVLRELKKDLNLMIQRDLCVIDDIKIYKDVTGLNVDKLTKEQLNELIVFCINNQLTRERKNKENNHGGNI